MLTSDPSKSGGLKNRAVFFSSKFVPFTITRGLLVRYSMLLLGYTVGVGITVATFWQKHKLGWVVLGFKLKMPSSRVSSCTQYGTTVLLNRYNSNRQYLCVTQLESTADGM